MITTESGIQLMQTPFSFSFSTPPDLEEAKCMRYPQPSSCL